VAAALTVTPSLILLPLSFPFPLSPVSLLALISSLLCSLLGSVIGMSTRSVMITLTLILMLTLAPA